MLRLILLNHMCIIAFIKRGVFFAFGKKSLLHRKKNLDIESTFY